MTYIELTNSSVLDKHFYQVTDHNLIQMQMQLQRIQHILEPQSEQSSKLSSDIIPKPKIMFQFQFPIDEYLFTF